MAFFKCILRGLIISKVLMAFLIFPCVGFSDDGDSWIAGEQKEASEFFDRSKFDGPEEKYVAPGSGCGAGYSYLTQVEYSGSRKDLCVKDDLFERGPRDGSDRSEGHSAGADQDCNSNDPLIKNRAIKTGLCKDPSETADTTPDTTTPTTAEAQQTACKAAAEKAEDCCSDPVKCTLGTSGLDIGTMNGMLLSAPTLMGGLSQNLNAVCSSLKAATLTGAGLNTSMSVACLNKVNKCHTACSQVTDSSGEYVMAEQLAQCAKLKTKGVALASAAAMSLVSSGVAAQCDDKTTTLNAGDGTLPPAPGSKCSQEEFKNTDECKCYQPGAENDPACAHIYGKTTDDGTPSDVDTLAGDGGAFDPNGLLDEGEGQEPNFDMGDGDTPRSNAKMQAGGGLPGGGGGSDFGSGGGESGGGAQEAGAKTDILKGTGGGNGYRVAASGGFNSSGGFRGYGSGSDKAGSGGKGADGFNLKAFLPGGKKDPRKRRQLAAVGSPEIGGAHENIWTRISKRVYNICSQNRLYDCGGPKNRLKSSSSSSVKRRHSSVTPGSSRNYAQKRR